MLVQSKTTGVRKNVSAFRAKALIRTGAWVEYKTRNIEEYHAPQMVAEKPREIVISEYVRVLAEENGIDVRSVQGSGKDGRIKKRDIEALISENPGF